MYSKTCPIPVKNVRDKLIEMTPLSSLLSDFFPFQLRNNFRFPTTDLLPVNKYGITSGVQQVLKIHSF
jgi:hypothetical protein